MRLLIVLLLCVCLPYQGWAQNTALEEHPLTKPTVSINAKVVQIILNDEHRQGVDWEAIVSDFHNLQLKKEDNPIWSDKRYRLSIGEVSNEDYAVLLDALDTVGRVSLSDFPVFSFEQDVTKSADLSPDSKVPPLIHLDLTWYNSPAGEPKLKIDPTIGVMIKDSNNPNAIVMLKNWTELDLKDNTTIVIGGLMHEEEITKTRKIPLLGHLPLVGLVFRKQGRLMQRSETMIFLTVHTNPVETTTEEQK